MTDNLDNLASISVSDRNYARLRITDLQRFGAFKHAETIGEITTWSLRRSPSIEVGKMDFIVAYDDIIILVSQPKLGVRMVQPRATPTVIEISAHLTTLFCDP